MQAQQVDTGTLQWTVTSTTNLKNNDTFAYACTFVTRGSASIDWVQKNGTRTTTYTVTSVVGQWPDVAQPGSVTYNIQKDALTGTLVVERSQAGAISITIDFSQSSATAIQQKFFVSEITTVN